MKNNRNDLTDILQIVTYFFSEDVNKLLIIP